MTARRKRQAGFVASLSIGSFGLAAFAAPPHVIKATPDHGDANVDPATTEIRVEFDVDMDQRGFSWVGGGPTFPQLTGKPHWVSPRVCILPVKLEGGRDYWVGINSVSHRSFRSTSGGPAEPYPIAFRTRKAGEPVREQLDLDHKSSIEALRRAIHERYSYRDRLGVDWTRLFKEREQDMLSANTTAAFAREAASLLSHAKDLHLWLMVDGITIPTTRRAVHPLMNKEWLASEIPHWNQRSKAIWSGKFDDGIGYILIEGWNAENTVSLTGAFLALTEFADTKALIIDVRPNSGGNETLAQQFAGCFISEPCVYAKHVYRDPGRPGGFSNVSERILSPNKLLPRYDKPVAVLMGPANMSSCEAFLLMMRQVPGCTLVGRPSYGSSGNPQPVALPNGVTVFVPSWKAMDADGIEFEGKGIEPDVLVDCNAADFATADPILSKALDVLRGKVSARSNDAESDENR